MLGSYNTLICFVILNAIFASDAFNFDRYIAARRRRGESFQRCVPEPSETGACPRELAGSGVVCLSQYGSYCTCYSRSYQFPEWVCALRYSGLNDYL